MIKNKIEILS